ncbi:MAG: glycogen debranching enzyme N-terminal domain-containing protein, partial [Vicinamibacteria bacterium]|nr:glycogen debranching enzyme N-terminal domain-containing protein [Vicinamibacteria bacterium]
MRTLGPDELRDLDRAERLEWLQADGRGGWASSTVLGLNARRDHSLLVVNVGFQRRAEPVAGPMGAASQTELLRPQTPVGFQRRAEPVAGPMGAASQTELLRPQTPVSRVSLLARVDERLEFADGTAIELATNRYEGAVHPRGLDYAESFTLDPLPALAFATPRGRLVKTLARPHDTDAVVVQYEWEGAEPVALAVRPLLAYREVHDLQHERADFRREAIALGDSVACAPLEGWPSLTMRLAGAQWHAEGWWYRRFEYTLERERGLDHHEDLWSPGEFRVGLRPGRAVALVAAAGAPPGADPLVLLQHEKRRQRALSAGSGGLEAVLRRAADAFLVRHEAHGHGVIVSYPAPEPDGGLGAEELRLRRSPHGTGDGLRPAPEPDGGLGAEELRLRRSPHG